MPIEEVKEYFSYKTVEELLERAKGLYESGNTKEGIVIRPQTNEFCSLIFEKLSFKVINNEYLTR